MKEAPGPALGKLARALIKDAKQFASSIEYAYRMPEYLRSTARQSFESLRAQEVRKRLQSMPIERLRDITQGRLRLAPIEAAGFKTVAEVQAAGVYRLQALRSVGPQTATQVVAAANQLEIALREGIRFRFDADGRSTDQAMLLSALEVYGRAEDVVEPLRPHMKRAGEHLEALLRRSRVAANPVKMFFVRGKRRQAVATAVSEIQVFLRSDQTIETRSALDEAVTVLTSPKLSAESIWDRFESNAASFNGLLIEVGDMAPDEEAVQGYVPGEIAARVNDQQLNTEGLVVSLRGYQAFGAKFALVQERAILGDEMGLGKTIEALAAMSHLDSVGKTHFLVVCPASVLVNWIHEIERHSRLLAHRLHGSLWERNRRLDLWIRRGGIAVTTFGTLGSLVPPPDLAFAMLVVDEAHFIKYPRARRTGTVREWMTRSERTLFLTGTPMENRVQEFQSLVSYLNPPLAQRIHPKHGLAGAVSFRKAVAPVYLRRNQADVLEELPPRIQNDDWVTLAGEDFAAYRVAVASGNFMAMRQAAYEPENRSGSSKLERLAEIVEESASNGWKVVVFSYFLNVLQSVRAILEPELLAGIITGRVRPTERQDLVDAFTARRDPGVLLSQIEAGGVGLNLQTASVVILAEPQWKPTTEDQAVARCHRMGQVRPVNVHRLIAEESVDQRMLEILQTKALLFNEYVRRSALKDVTPDAVDVSNVQSAREVVSVTEAERRIIDLEQKRLGVDPSGIA